MEGVLLVDKPESWTSFDAVNYVRRMVAQLEGKKPKNVKVGHTGTLDPFATGLLVLLIGKNYTRRAGEISKADKSYEVTLVLGKTSTTGDPEGVISSVDAPEPSREQFEQALAQFRGEIQQIPPAYSAVKVGGQRAYKLARAGKEVIIEPRTVRIGRLELQKYEFPQAELIAEVSSGTYIRTLVEDIAKVLQTGAYTTALRRTAVGNYSLEEAMPVSQLDAVNLSSRLIDM